MGTPENEGTGIMGCVLTYGCFLEIWIHGSQDIDEVSFHV